MFRMTFSLKRRRTDMTSTEKLATPETVRKALQRAYSLGQTYWQQADSESFSQNRKADETAAKFQALVEETVACVLATQRQGEGETRDAALEQAANLVECEYAADATQGRRLAQIAQHIRDLKKRGV